MATRMQQRRATAEQWLLADPTLAEGEIGIETDTSSFKVGDGVNSWSLLDYFESSTSLQATIDNYVPLTEKGAALGVATLDANGFVPATQLDIDLTPYYTSVETDSAISSAVSGLVDTAPATLDTLNELAAALGDDPNFATTVTNSIAAKADATHTHPLADVTDVTATAAELNVLDGITATTAELNYTDGVTSNIQTQLNEKLPLTGGTLDAGANTGLEMIGTSAAYIDFKDSAADDFDARLINVAGAKGLTIEATGMTTSRTLRNITISTADPSGGIDGDVWLKYTA